MSQLEKEIPEMLRRGCEALQLNLNDDAFLALECYYNELQHWSRKINLIAKKQTPQQIIETHFLDSLILLPYVEQTDSLADIGSGAGFPGLVLKAVLPDLRLVLVEPRLKRVSFLRHIVRTLKLNNVEVMANRIEEVDGTALVCSTVTSRAVAEILDFLQMIEGIVGHHTRIICMKGPKWQEELERASVYMQEKDIIFERALQFELPFSGARRAILFLKRNVPLQ